MASHYAYDDIYWQRTPNAGHVPFTALAHLPTTLYLLLMVALVIHPFGSIVLPVLIAWVGSQLRRQWAILPWPSRVFVLGTVILAVPTVALVWPPFGRMITTWLMD